jgi:hypothetical protein
MHAALTEKVEKQQKIALRMFKNILGFMVN